MADPNVQRALDEALRAPEAWLDAADQLKRASDLLLVGFQNDVAAALGLQSLEDAPAIKEVASTSARPPRSEFALGSVYLLVAGYAIENLAKGLIVAHDQRDQTIKQITREHVSPDLLQRAGVSFADGESDLVERLAVRVTWAGRYPVPTSAAALETARFGGLWENVLRVSTTDGRTLDDLYARMRADLAVLL